MKNSLKTEKNKEIERKLHFGPLYLSTHRGYEKRKFIM